MISRDRIATGFDRLAPGYDTLVHLVYGSRVRAAQSCFLDCLPAGGRALVVGGGSGWFLEQLLLQMDPREVVYLELSPAMLSAAERRVRRRLPQVSDRIRFVEGGMEALPTDDQFDVVCTHCFLDLFDDATLPGVVERLARCLAPGAVWYFSDFCPAEGFPMAGVSRLLLWAMYRFFRGTCGIQARRLPNIDAALRDSCLNVNEEQLYYGGMIRALLLRRGTVGMAAGG